MTPREPLFPIHNMSSASDAGRGSSAGAGAGVGAGAGAGAGAISAPQQAWGAAGESKAGGTLHLKYQV